MSKTSQLKKEHEKRLVAPELAKIARAETISTGAETLISFGAVEELEINNHSDTGILYLKFGTGVAVTAGGFDKCISASTTRVFHKPAGATNFSLIASNEDVDTTIVGT